MTNIYYWDSDDWAEALKLGFWCACIAGGVYACVVGSQTRKENLKQLETYISNNNYIISDVNKSYYTKMFGDSAIEVRNFDNMEREKDNSRMFDYKNHMIDISSYTKESTGTKSNKKTEIFHQHEKIPMSRYYDLNKSWEEAAATAYKANGGKYNTEFSP